MVVIANVEDSVPPGGRGKVVGERLVAGPLGAIVLDRVIVPLKPSRLVTSTTEVTANPMDVEVT